MICLHRAISRLHNFERRDFQSFFTNATTLKRDTSKFLSVPIKKLKIVVKTMATASDTSSRTNINNGLLLYYHQYSFYSQKVVMALHEKCLSFDSHIVNIAKGEQYKAWFLKLNPRGEVPVLQDSAKIIPDSSRIIDYLEDNFSNGNTPRLIPLTLSPETKQKVKDYRQMLDQLPGGVLTMGSLFHPHLTRKPKAPFIAPVRKALASAEKNSSKMLREYAEKNPEAREVLLQKAAMQDKRHQTILNEAEYLKVLRLVDNALEEVEAELGTHTGDKSKWWLCCETFTVADISLTILLDRLNALGLEHRFWSEGRRPAVCTYYERVRQRESYKKTIPNALMHVRLFLGGNAPLVIGVGIVSTLAFIIGGVFLVKKIIR